MARALGIGIVLWPYAFCALLGLRRAGRALTNRLTNRRSH